MRYCKNCGKSISDTAVFCSACGTKQNDVNPFSQFNKEDIEDNDNYEFEYAEEEAIIENEGFISRILHKLPVWLVKYNAIYMIIVLVIDLLLVFTSFKSIIQADTFSFSKLITLILSILVTIGVAFISFAGYGSIQKNYLPGQAYPIKKHLAPLVLFIISGSALLVSTAGCKLVVFIIMIVFAIFGTYVSIDKAKADMLSIDQIITNLSEEIAIASASLLITGIVSLLLSIVVGIGLFLCYFAVAIVVMAIVSSFIFGPNDDPYDRGIF